MKAFIRSFNLFAIIFLVSSCNAQNQQKAGEKKDRQPAVAGSFYSANKDQLLKSLKDFFNEVPENKANFASTIIVPHAGYVFSGGVAAAGYKQIDPEKQYKHIFIIGSSHTMYFNGASIYPSGSFITPLGKVPVDILASSLVSKHKILTDNTQPHLKEHSIEVQLPFLQYRLKKPFSIIPIIIGGESKKTCEQLADILRPYFIPENLFIISTDFSHYPSYDDAKQSDLVIANAVLSNSPELFLQAKLTDENKNIQNLATAMCGWTSVLTLLYVTENMDNLAYKKIAYKNSGDSPYGDKEKVVGYCAISVTETEKSKQEDRFSLTNNEKIELLSIARNSINSYITNKTVPEIDSKTLTKKLQTPMGAFVTLKKNNTLRGCIGSFQPDQPLYKVVQSMAVASSTQDYRFSPVKPDEIDKIEIEISVLTPMKKINSIDEIELGRHGIYIKKGNRSGTFLPQVADETGWDKEEFLGHCAQDKASIGWNGWKEADIYTYEALVFGEHDFRNNPKE